MNLGLCLTVIVCHWCMVTLHFVCGACAKGNPLLFSRTYSSFWVRRRRFATSTMKALSSGNKRVLYLAHGLTVRMEMALLANSANVTFSQVQPWVMCRLLEGNKSIPKLAKKKKRRRKKEKTDTAVDYDCNAHLLVVPRIVLYHTCEFHS